MNNQSEYRLADSTATPLRALAIALALLTFVAAMPALAQATDAAAPAAAAPKQQPMRGMPGAAAAPQMAQPAAVKVTAEVLETMNAANYTYVRVKTASGDVWAAGPRTDVKVGDTISFDRGVPMTNFESKSAVSLSATARKRRPARLRRQPRAAHRLVRRLRTRASAKQRRQRSI